MRCQQAVNVLRQQNAQIKQQKLGKTKDWKQAFKWEAEHKSVKTKQNSVEI